MDEYRKITPTLSASCACTVYSAHFFRAMHFEDQADARGSKTLRQVGGMGYTIGIFLSDISTAFVLANWFSDWYHHKIQIFQLLKGC